MRVNGPIADYIKDRALINLDEEAVIDHALFKCYEDLKMIAEQFNNPRAKALAEEIQTIKLASMDEEEAQPWYSQKDKKLTEKAGLSCAECGNPIVGEPKFFVPGAGGSPAAVCSKKCKYCGIYGYEEFSDFEESDFDAMDEE